MTTQLFLLATISVNKDISNNHIKFRFFIFYRIASIYPLDYIAVNSVNFKHYKILIIDKIFMLVRKEEY